MLNSISITNIALISDITINLNSGLNVFTGETGAGKSLIIGSISLLLGDKADKSLISYNKDYAYVEAVFTSNHSKVFTLLQEIGIQPEETTIVSRKLYKEGKNECRINGKSVTLSVLKKIVAPLMDLHGQFEHQSILNNKNQLAILDGLGATKISVIKDNFADMFAQYQSINKELASFTEDDAQRNRLIDLYEYQIEEITNANFKEGEEEFLKEYRQKILNLEKIALNLENSTQLANYGLNGGGGIVETLSRLMGLISNIKQYSSNISELYDRLDSAKIDIVDIVDSLQQEQDSLQFDWQEAKINEERLDLLSLFKKKYGKDIPAINEYLQKITEECNRLKNSEEYILKLKQQKESLINKLNIAGKQLTEERKKVAQILEEKIKRELVDLAMKNTSFLVDFIQIPLQNADESGLDGVEYMFSANAGQPPKPLNKVISGGEMSRFMLAVKNITADIEDIDTMIFDEIDTGVSGFVAEELAKKLLTIAVKRQVICVSHLSQVASFSNHHYYINKKTENGVTNTHVKLLNENEKINEIARLIGGTISSHSIQHAKFMIESKDNFLKSLK